MPDFNSPLGRYGFIERWAGNSTRRWTAAIALVIVLAFIGGSVAPLCP